MSFVGAVLGYGQVTATFIIVIDPVLMMPMLVQLPNHTQEDIEDIKAKTD